MKKKILAALLTCTMLICNSMTIFAETVNPSGATIPVTYTINEYYCVAVPATVTLSSDADNYFGTANRCYGHMFVNVYGVLPDGGINCEFALPEMVNGDNSALKSQLYCLTKYDAPDGTAKSFLNSIGTTSTGIGQNMVFFLINTPENMVSSQKGNIVTAMSDPDSPTTSPAKSLSEFTYQITKDQVSSTADDRTNHSLLYNNANDPAFLLYWDPPTTGDIRGTYTGNITVDFSRYH